MKDNFDFETEFPEAPKKKSYADLDLGLDFDLSFLDDIDESVLDDVVEEHIVTEMMAWDAETRRSYTGQYRLEDIVWSGSYTCLTDEGYVDVFTVPFAYKVAEDMEESVVPRDGMVLGEGWLVDAGRLRVALLHDGSAVERVIFLRTDAAASGQPGFAAELMAAGLAG